MQVLVSILSYNNVADTLACLETLAALPARQWKKVVVDNGSRLELAKQLAEAIEQRYSDVEFISSQRNRGFAGGHNFTLENFSLDEFDYVLLLNNDTVVPPGSLESLLDTAQAEAADICGPLITYYPEKRIVWQGGGMLSPFSGRLRVPLKQKSVEAADASVQEVDFISGCVMLVSTRLIGRIGLFDPQYFYSVEDLDLCITAKKAGARILFFPDIVVHHKLAVTAAGWHSYFAVGHNVWGKARFLRKHFRGIHSLLPVLLHFTLFVPLKALQLELPLHRRVLRIADLLGFSVQGLTGKPHPRLMPENQGEKKGLQV